MRVFLFVARGDTPVETQRAVSLQENAIPSVIQSKISIIFAFASIDNDVE